MKNWILLGLVYWLTSCEPTLDEAPQILSVSIEGIPQDNITIDQAQRIVTVVLPPTVASLDLKPRFLFSKQASIADPITIDLRTTCPGWSPIPTDDYTTVAKIVDRVDNKRQSTHYTFVVKRGGPLRIRPLSTPIVYEARTTSEIVVPVENGYSTNYVGSIAVTPTGSAQPNRITADGVPMGRCTDGLNELSISLSGYANSLKPGLHDLDLWSADGTQVHATGAILVK